MADGRSTEVLTAESSASGVPLPNGANTGRTTGGRFAPGNPGGPGNPHNKRVGQLRSMLLAAVTDEDIKAIARKLIDRAKSGDMHAIRELLDRTIGKPAQADVLERIESLEAMLSRVEQTNG